MVFLSPWMTRFDQQWACVFCWAKISRPNSSTTNAVRQLQSFSIAGYPHKYDPRCREFHRHSNPNRR